MKEISIKDLKRRLSTILREASEGASFVVTSHNKPCARLTGTDPAYLHRGRRFGHGNLKPLLRGRTRGRYLDVLSEDRQEPRQRLSRS